MNRLVLSAQMVERGAVRYTPAGLPACDMVLKHESQLTEAGHPRKVSMEIRAVLIGDLVPAFMKLELGTQATFAGFLTNQRNGRGTVFHVTEFARAESQAST
jgi:primosomal replication protein N